MINVLDYGYIKFVEAWGHGDQEEPFNVHMRDHIDFERGIIEAARQSTQGSFRGWDQDSKLLAFLFNNKHATPFEFAGMVIEVQAPIFVFREWQRHRTQSYNEMSARYTALPPLYYTPTIERLMMNAGKQGGMVPGAVPLTTTYAEQYRRRRIDENARWEAQYVTDLQMGVPKELARGGMPVEHYSRMRCQANLRNWLAFLTLRQDPAAQWEIRQYANAVGEIISTKFRRTWELFKSSQPRSAPLDVDAADSAQ